MAKAANVSSDWSGELDVALLVLVVSTLVAVIFVLKSKMNAKKKSIYDFSQEFPAPHQILTRTDSLINDLVKRIDMDGVPTLSVDEEADLQLTLFGLGRMVEVNVRTAWELFAIEEGIQDSQPKRYIGVLKYFEAYFQPESLHVLFKSALQITDGLVHGNFFQAFTMARKAYERKDLGLHQDAFNVQTIVITRLTNRGLNVDARSGIATDSDGNPVPHRSYLPGKDKPLIENFEAFFVSGAFAFVYDVLKTAYSRAYHLRKCLEAGKSNV